MSLIKEKAGNKITPICILLFIGILIIPVVSAASIQPINSNVTTSSSGNFIFKPLVSPKIVLPANQKVTFFFQVDTKSIPSKPLPYNENATACGDCGINWNVVLYIPIQPHFTPAPTILNLNINQNGEFIYDSVYNETAFACGNCGMSDGIYSFV
jgi:hypothetical protein